MALKSVPRKVFGSSRAPVKFTGKNDVIFSGPNFLCALRNTRKLFRGLYGDVFGTEMFSGLLRNARQGANIITYGLRSRLLKGFLLSWTAYILHALVSGPRYVIFTGQHNWFHFQ